jgi:hypothetical protein
MTLHLDIFLKNFENDWQVCIIIVTESVVNGGNVKTGSKDLSTLLTFP